MQVSPVLRRYLGGYSHWCPGCEDMHVISDGWSFNGNLDQPTFYPSVKITGKKTVKENGEWVGGWELDSHGNPIDFCCHYFIVSGEIRYCDDCTHELSGQTVPLPKLPSSLQDGHFDVELVEPTEASDEHGATANFSIGVTEQCKAKAG